MAQVAFSRGTKLVISSNSCTKLLIFYNVFMSYNRQYLTRIQKPRKSCYTTQSLSLVSLFKIYPLPCLPILLILDLGSTVGAVGLRFPCTRAALKSCSNFCLHGYVPANPSTHFSWVLIVILFSLLYKLLAYVNIKHRNESRYFRDWSHGVLGQVKNNFRLKSKFLTPTISRFSMYFLYPSDSDAICIKYWCAFFRS